MFRANSPKFPKFRGWSDPPARGVKGSSLALPALLELSPNPRLSAPAPHSTVHTAPPARRVRPLPCSPALPSQNARVGSSSATLPGPAWPPMSCEWSNGPVCLWDQLQDQVSGCQGVGLAGRHSCRLLPRGASADCDQTSRGSRDAAVGGCWVEAWGPGARGTLRPVHCVSPPNLRRRERQDGTADGRRLSVTASHQQATGSDHCAKLPVPFPRPAGRWRFNILHCLVPLGSGTSLTRWHWTGREKGLDTPVADKVEATSPELGKAPSCALILPLLTPPGSLLDKLWRHFVPSSPPTNRSDLRDNEHDTQIDLGLPPSAVSESLISLGSLRVNADFVFIPSGGAPG